jgi:hemolysin III
VITNVFAATTPRAQTLNEERANSLSHALGLAAALAAAWLLISASAQRGDPAFLAGVWVYALSGVGLYLASTLYHALPPGRAKDVLLVCDHSAIFIFIAACYTPFSLGVLRGPWALTLLAVVWLLAAGGVAFKIITGPDTYPKLGVGLYIAMGWTLLLAVGPLWQLLPPAGLAWLLAGGLAYTVGIAFFRAEQVRYAHFVWHLAVLSGTICHFVAVLLYAAGR